MGHYMIAIKECWGNNEAELLGSRGGGEGMLPYKFF